MPDFFLYQDVCHQSCPNHFYADAGQCVPCHEDCLKCSGPSEDDCDLCADTSSVLYDGWCLDECPTGTYYEKEIKECKGKRLPVWSQMLHHREPSGATGLCRDKGWSGACTVLAPDLSSYPFPSCSRKRILNLL